MAWPPGPAVLKLEVSDALKMREQANWKTIGQFPGFQRNRTESTHRRSSIRVEVLNIDR
jgi:hypothetical protein